MSEQIIEIDEDGKVTIPMKDCCRAAVEEANRVSRQERDALVKSHVEAMKAVGVALKEAVQAEQEKVNMLQAQNKFIIDNAKEIAEEALRMENAALRAELRNVGVQKDANASVAAEHRATIATLQEALVEVLPILEQRAENLYGCSGEGGECFCSEEADAISLRNKVRVLAKGT